MNEIKQVADLVWRAVVVGLVFQINGLEFWRGFVFMLGILAGLIALLEDERGGISGTSDI